MCSRTWDGAWICEGRRGRDRGFDTTVRPLGPSSRAPVFLPWLRALFEAEVIALRHEILVRSSESRGRSRTERPAPATQAAPNGRPEWKREHLFPLLPAADRNLFVPHEVGADVAGAHVGRCIQRNRRIYRAWRRGSSDTAALRRVALSERCASRVAASGGEVDDARPRKRQRPDRSRGVSNHASIKLFTPRVAVAASAATSRAALLSPAPVRARRRVARASGGRGNSRPRAGQRWV